MKEILAGSASIFTIASVLLIFLMRDMGARTILVLCSLFLWAAYGLVCSMSRTRNKHVRLELKRNDDRRLR